MSSKYCATGPCVPFNRFSDECEDCSCYIENCDEGDVIDPDSECALSEKTYGMYPCDFFDNCRR